MPKAGGEYKPRTKTDAPARLTLALGWTLWQKPPAYWQGCGSSVVEHSLGKGEVESSILSCSTIRPPFFLRTLLPSRAWCRLRCRNDVGGWRSRGVLGKSSTLWGASRDSGGPASLFRSKVRSAALTPSISSMARFPSQEQLSPEASAPAIVNLAAEWQRHSTGAGLSSCLAASTRKTLP